LILFRILRFEFRILPFYQGQYFVIKEAMRMSEPVDLRSDTLSRPTPDMRQAISQAAVGDDVFGEDPTVNQLQEKVAELLGKEEALFCASGTMANEVAIRTHTSPADEVIIEANAHPVTAEAGAPAALSGVQLRTLQGVRGVLLADQVNAAIRPKDIHRPPSRLICLENTHNMGGGNIYPLEEILRIREVADFHGIDMHLDGARLMNACVASGISPRAYAAPFDSVSLCLSKGLGAPVGSMLAGSGEFIERSRRFRKMFGGGMRQAGILAAAGLHALEHHVDRLAEDHRHARMLAEALADCAGIDLDVEHVQTNIVVINIAPSGLKPAEAAEQLKKAGVRVLPFGPTHLRAVTYLDVDQEGIERAIPAFGAIFN
jgi:threonine aldolase